MTNATDVRIDDDVFTTVQLKTYHKGRLPMFVKLARAAKATVEKEIRSKLTPECNSRTRIIYHFKNLKTTNTHGRCRRNNENLITILINPKACKDLHKMAETIGHELVHAEQYLTGKLSIDGAYHRWNGQKVVNRGSTYAAYRSLPWEVEAFDRQSKNAEKILNAFHLMSGSGA